MKKGYTSFQCGDINIQNEALSWRHSMVSTLEILDYVYGVILVDHWILTKIIIETLETWPVHTIPETPDKGALAWLGALSYQHMLFF